MSGPLGSLRRLRNDQGQVCRCIKTGKRQVCAVDGIEDGFVAWLCLARLGDSRFHGAEHVPELGGSKVLSPTKRVAPSNECLAQDDADRTAACVHKSHPGFAPYHVHAGFRIEFTQFLNDGLKAQAHRDAMVSVADGGVQPV